LDDRIVMGHLEAAAEQLGVEIRFEPLEGDGVLSSGGMCRIRGKTVIIVNKKSSVGDQVRTVVRALRRIERGQIYLRPGIRVLLESETGEDEGG